MAPKDNAGGGILVSCIGGLIADVHLAGNGLKEKKLEKYVDFSHHKS